jgi:hypothetical protein
MTDTMRTRSYMVGDGSGTTGTFANNTSGAITAQIVRDLIASISLTIEESRVLVQRGSTDILSGTALRNAYTAAKALTPGGNAISGTNRVAIIIPPGRYDLVTTPLVLDTEGVDLVGMGGTSDVVITSQVNTDSHGTIEQTAIDVQIRNLTIHINATSGSGTGELSAPAAFFPPVSDSVHWGHLMVVQSDNLFMTNANEIRCPNPTFRNGNYIYAHLTIDGLTAYYRFYSDVAEHNLIGHTDAFTGNGQVSILSDNSSGLSGYIIFNNWENIATEDGIIIRVAGRPVYENVNFVSADEAYAFSMSPDAGHEHLGTYINCRGGAYSFGPGTGTFVNCEGGNYSFGTDSYAMGTFINCTGGDNSFVVSTGSTGEVLCGTFVNCHAGAGSFGGGSDDATVAGLFIDCVAGNGSWGGGADENVKGTFINCRGGNSCFVDALGNSMICINCIAGESSFGCAGYYENCIGGMYSWGGASSPAYGYSFTGTLKNCALGSVTGSTVIYGVSDWNNPNFAGIMDGCYWKVTGSTPAITITDNNGTIYNSTILGGTGYSIEGNSKSMTYVHCRIKGAVHNLTNNIVTPYNLTVTT